MGTIILDFADQLFSFMALKYEIASPRGPAEDAPPIEEYDWPSEHFSIDIARAVMMLSYTYRSAFRRHFKSVSPLICASRETAKLYPVIFARVTYKCYSPLKVLVLCSFISEMYLYIYFQSGSNDASRRYTIPCMNCFNIVYKTVLSRIFDPIPRWYDVKHAATLIARGYKIFEPIMKTEHPSESKFFFRSIQDVLAAEGKARLPEETPEIFRDEATNERTSQFMSTGPLSLTKSQYLAASHRLMSKNAKSDQANQQSIPQTSSSKASTSKSDKNSFGDDQSKPHGKKGKKKPPLQSLLKTKASAKSNAPESKPTAITNTAKLPLQTSGASTGARPKVIDETKSRDFAFSFGTVDQITPKIPGFDDVTYTSFECDNPEGKPDKSSKDSDRESKTSSDSSRAKSKSKKHKKRK